jgi:hypothetical protein
MEVMKKLEKLKHIRRELNIILEVVTQQMDIVSQMIEDIKDEELQIFKASDDIEKRLTRRTKKLERRRELILALDKKADNIFKDVSVPRFGKGIGALSDSTAGSSSFPRVERNNRSATYRHSSPAG